MSSAGISFGGLASGLDTQAIISALVAVERRPIQQLETKKTSLNKSKSLFGDLDGLLDKLQSAAKSLKTTSDFLKMQVASDDEDILTATATSAAAPGTHRIEVLALAKAQIHATSGSASSSASIGGGDFTIDVGGHTLIIETPDTSLDGLAAAINAEAETQGANLRAEVVDTGGAAATRYQLVVRSTETGAENGFTISAATGDPGFTAVVNSLRTGVKSAATDAHALVNGIDVFRSTNSMTGAIAGVTLDLKSIPDPAKEVTITVSTDATETAKKVQEFVDAYNKVVDFFTEQNVLDAEGKAKSPLFGDVTLRSIRSNLRNVLGSQVATSGNEKYELLSQLGIKADTQGKLTFTQSKLEEALADDENAVAAVFTDATNGIAGKLETAIDLYTDSVDGLLKARTDGFDRQVKQTQRRIEDSERRLELYQKQLEAKYANLESLLTRLQGQGSSISNINR
jgi:flagellar hook-associated protein 2